MKIYNKKYLFIGIFASLVTACGSGGGSSDGGATSISSSSSSNTSKPSTDIVLPTNLEKISDKIEEKPMAPVIAVIPEIRLNDKAEPNNKVQPEEMKEVIQPEPKAELEEIKIESPKLENIKPEDKVEPPKSENVEPTDKEKPIPSVQSGNDEAELDDKVQPEPNEPLTNNNTGVLNVKQGDRAGLIALSGKPATNEISGKIYITEEYTSGMLSMENDSKSINKGIIEGKQLDFDGPMNLMFATGGGSLENSGIINGVGLSTAGMYHRSSHGEGFTSINNGEINLKNKPATAGNELLSVTMIGMGAEKYIEVDDIDEDVTIINNKDIFLHTEDSDIPNLQKSISVRGMSISVYDNSIAKNIMTNNGTIAVTGIQSVGMHANGSNITMTNKGTIKSKSEDSAGMVGYGENIKVINEGTIDIEGTHSTGIRVSDGTVGINEINGVININGQNSIGMSALNGSKIINKGKITLKGNSIGMSATTPEYDVQKYPHTSIVNEGEIIFKDSNISKIAIRVSGNASYMNRGKIIGADGVEILASDKAQFIVGKETTGDVAVVRSRRSLKITGNVVASKDLIEGNKKEIVYSDVFSAPKVELVRATDPKAVSLFYNSKLALNKNGNADMLVYRNKATVEKSYESTEFKSLTSSLDRYLSIENMNLSEGEKLVMDRVLKADNINDVRKVVKNLSGEIYANLPRQIFDIQDRFVKEDMKLIDSLNEHSYNFNFFGDKTSVKDKGEISGYKSTSGGFVGTKKFQDNLYATIGYESSDIKYSEGSKGSIQSIHTGLYKKLSLNEFNIDLGLNGEYNFHETNREIDSFNVRAKGKYNSYTLGANGEISRVYGESLYFKPSAGLNLGYGQYEKFTEKNAGDLGLMVKDESYFSIVPKVGFKVGKNFEFIDIYSNVIYSYELGDLNKKQGMSLLGDKVHYTLNSDSLEKASLAANVGVSTEIKDFKVTLEVGKEFGKRENNYLALGVGYKF